jgi:hypothetical protein
MVKQNDFLRIKRESIFFGGDGIVGRQVECVKGMDGLVGGRG